MRRAALILLLLAIGAGAGIGIYVLATRKPPAPDAQGLPVVCSRSAIDPRAFAIANGKCWQAGQEVQPPRFGPCGPSGDPIIQWSSIVGDDTRVHVYGCVGQE